MLSDITLGQFFPGNSPLHKLDPRMKIFLIILFIVTIFCASSLLSFCLVLGSAAFLTILSRIPLRQILKGLRPLFLIMLFTAILNIFWTSGENLLWQWGFVKIYAEGLWYALFMIVRVVTLIIGSSVLLTYTTSPIALTDGLERVLSPLRVLHLPVHEFSMMMTIALRFIPTLIQETDKIINAQKARGADFTSGSLFQRMHALVPVMVPLFVSAFHRADELAVAMECRCYHGGEGRTRMTQLHLSGRDYLFLFFMLALFALVLLCNSVSFW
ncbi:MAG: energy-coupling factor transporter transmembrane protein EcfT [Clostridia bacterium]|nr:energy-coupling factor transporter transmembrane protein EcfT [Clostridia bacterium]